MARMGDFSMVVLSYTYWYVLVRDYITGFPVPMSTLSTALSLLQQFK